MHPWPGEFAGCSAFSTIAKTWRSGGGDVGDAPWYPDLKKLDDIARNVGFEARKITPDDLELLREYHLRSGRPLGPRRVRKLRERWAAGDECYVAIDRDGSVAACMWIAYSDHYVEAIHDVFPVGPSDVLSYDVDTRPDKRGNMGFLACSCASVAEGIRRGRRRGISWSSPDLFEEFRRLHWFSGLGTPHLFRIVRYRCICGLRFRSVAAVFHPSCGGPHQAVVPRRVTSATRSVPVPVGQVRCRSHR